ncbi:MAG: hypothetical protein R2750_12125 [Bacteroidales bacterium]
MQTDPYFVAKVFQYEPLENVKKNKEFKALIASLKDLSIQIIKQSPNIPSMQHLPSKILKVLFFLSIYFVNLNIDIDEKQALLEVSDFYQRAKKLLSSLTKELDAGIKKPDSG